MTLVGECNNGNTTCGELFSGISKAIGLECDTERGRNKKTARNE